MTGKISFTDIDISGAGVLTCNVTRDSSDEFWIELPYSFEPSHDLIAATYASLCGQKFDEIHIELPIGGELARVIEKMTRAKVTFIPGADIKHRRGEAQALNFSGGFDSLAALEMIPAAHLVSLDFGGNFARERVFYKRFTPFIFKTNLVDLKLNSYSWMFMGVGSILLRDELNLGSYSFGSIQAASLPRLFKGPLVQSQAGLHTANAVGMVNQNPVAGVSEIGAMSMVARNHSHLLIDMLKSVALPGEDKYLRKYQMLEAVSSRLEIPLQLPERPKTNKNTKWGASFATDLASLYIMKIIGADTVSESYSGGIPEKILNTFEQYNMDFMEKYNPHAYHGVENFELGNWFRVLSRNKIYPFDAQDWSDAAGVIELLETDQGSS